MKQKWIITGVGMLLFGITLGVFYLAKSSMEEHKKKERAKKVEKARADSTRVAQQEQQKIQTPNPWSPKTLDIPREGVMVYLYPGWTDCPLGGAITITPIDNRGNKGIPLHDKPREINHFPYQPEGNFLVLGDPVGSKRSVQIYNRW